MKKVKSLKALNKETVTILNSYQKTKIIGGSDIPTETTATTTGGSKNNGTRGTTATN